MNQTVNKEIRVHKVGTVTLGIVLIAFGILYLLQHFVKAITFTLIMRMWPIVLIILGIEVLLGTKSEKFEFSIGAIITIMLMTCWAFGMGSVEYFIQMGAGHYFSI